MKVIACLLNDIDFFNDIFTTMKVFFTAFFVTLLIYFIPGRASAQDITIKGRVTASDYGTGLPGASVLIKGTFRGAVTNMEGDYEIVAANNAVLEFSFIGYELQEISVNNRTGIDVILNVSQLELKEIVVTALGIQKEKKALGYSVQEVDGASMEKAKEPNVISSLTGRVAGLVIYNKTGIYENPEILLRGSKPLIVINGIPSSTDMWDVSSDDIENVSVLKGTTASALYGSLGKDGAIMITTKKGTKDKRGFETSFNSSTMFEAGFVAIPEVQHQYGTGYGGKYSYVDGKGGGIQDGSGWIWGPKLDQRDSTTASGYVEIAQYDSPIDSATGNRIPTPWVSRGKNNLRNFMEQGMVTTNNLSISYNDEKSNYRISLSHMYQNGMVPNTKLNSVTMSLAGGYKLGEKLRADASFTYNKQFTPNYPRGGYGPQNYVYNLLLWTGTDVDVRDLKNYWDPGMEGLQQLHYNRTWYNNPYFTAYENLQGYYKDVNYGNVTLTYDFTKNLSLKARSGLNWYGLMSDLKTPKSLILYSDPTDGNFETQMDKDFSLNSDVFLEYRKSWQDLWELNLTAGGNNRWEEHNYLYARTTGLNIPGFYNLSNSTGDVRASNSLRQKKVNSLYGTMDMNYKKAIYLGFTSRNDWSSALPVKNNSYFYPSVSLSTIISELIQMPAAIPFFKLRGSWAQVSNDLAVYSTTPVYNNSVNWNSNASVYFPGSQLNPNIRPETSKTWEAGSDIRLIKNRVGLDITYYHTIDENDIIYFPVSEASGYSSKLINANKYKREGWEVVLNLAPVKIPNSFSWDMSVNWSRHRRYLLELPEGQADLYGVKVGGRMDLYRGWVFNKSKEGKIIYEGGLPTWDPYIKKLGYQDPDWTWGFSNTLRYKFVKLGILLDGRYKGLIWSQTIRKMYWGGSHPGTVSKFRDDQIAGKATYVGDGVTVTGGEVIYDAQGNIASDTRTYDANTTPVYWSDWCQFYYHDVSDEAVTFDASFIKLRELTLTFDIPSKWVSKMKVERASVSFIGRNIWMWSVIKYVDPDTGVDDLQTPSSRNLGFNINLIF
jgi:TonB-linked SusC/RagA family outer membrane protein